MGLDLAELAMEIEERYAIELEVEAWKDIQTFGDLIDEVKRIIDRPLDPPIEESGNEIILQSLLAELRLRLPREVEVNQETRLKELRPYVKRYDIWPLVQQRFPELPTWRGFALRRTPYEERVSCLGLPWIGLLWIVGCWPHRTVGDVAQAIAKKRQKLLKARECSALDIENDLRAYMSEAFGLKPEKIRREHDLVKDLGLG